MVVRADPVVGAALGAAASFYALSAFPVFRADFCFALFMLLSCAAGASVAFRCGPVRAARAAASFALAFCVGAAFGASAAAAPLPRASWGLAGARVVSFNGIVASDPRTTRAGGFYLEAAPRSCEGSGGEQASASGLTAVFVGGTAGPPPPRGSAVRFFGRLADGRSGPAFAAARWEQTAPPPPAERVRASARAWVEKRLSARSWGGLAAALLIGSRDGLDRETAEAYAAAGCAHVLALSGMHLSLVSALLSLLLRPFLGLKKGLLLGCVLIVFYVYLSGAQASLVRSALMYGAAAAAVCCAASVRPLPLIAVAFLPQLVLDPAAARGLSFILSYAALVGLCTAGDALDDLSRAWLPCVVRPALAASVGAFLATAAVSAAAFGVLRPVGILASLFLAPAALALMAGSGLWLGLTALHPAFGWPVDAALLALGSANDAAVRAAARLPGIRTPSVLPVAALSLAAALLLVYGRIWRNHTRNRIDPID